MEKIEVLKMDYNRPAEPAGPDVFPIVRSINNNEIVIDGDLFRLVDLHPLQFNETSFQQHPVNRSTLYLQYMLEQEEGRGLAMDSTISKMITSHCSDVMLFLRNFGHWLRRNGNIYLSDELKYTVPETLQNLSTVLLRCEKSWRVLEVRELNDSVFYRPPNKMNVVLCLTYRTGNGFPRNFLSITFPFSLFEEYVKTTEIPLWSRDYE